MPCTQNIISKLKLSVPVGLLPDIPVDYNPGHHPIDSHGENAIFTSQSTANSMEFGFDLGSASGFDLDFENMDVDTSGPGFGSTYLDVSAVTFDYEKAFMQAALSIGIQENRSDSDNFQADSDTGSSQLVLPPSSYPSESHLNVNNMSSIQVGTTSAGLSESSLPVVPSPYTSGVPVPSAPPLPVSEPDDVHAHHQPTKRKKVAEVNAAHILPEGLQRIRTKSAKAAAALSSG